MEAKTIGIAIVESQDRFLIGTRAIGQALAGDSEFPGGKCERDESPEACAIRECFEETGLTVEPVEQLDRIRFEYPHATVDLHFWLCRETEPFREPQNGFRWVPRAELAALKFPAANAQIVQRLLEKDGV